MTSPCPNCGFLNPATFKFCGNCGTNLGAPSSRAPAEKNLDRIQGAIPPALAEKIALAGKQIEGERRQVTVLFADLSRFTTISEKLDPEDVYNFTDTALKAFIDEIYKHEGTLDKFMGDGIMALFGAPVAHEDDPARAVRAAIGMQQALARINEDLEPRLGVSLKVRIGLNSGLVVVGNVGSDLRMEYTALGDTVNVASRLQTVAEPRNVLVSRSVYDQTKPLFEFRERGVVNVKGREEPVEIFEAIGPRRKAERVRGIAGLNAPMVGREEEFRRVRLAVDELVADGTGKIVLVTGEAGMGKSRLTSELKLYLANKPAQILEGTCLSYGQSAYSIFLQMLKALFLIGEDDAEETVREKIENSVRTILSSDYAIPEVLPYIENLIGVRIIDLDLSNRIRHLEPAQLQQQTFLAIRDLFSAAAKQKPLILIFEDIHWIDKLSLELLTFMLGATENQPLLLYCNSRPTEGAAVPQLLRHGQEQYSTRFVHLPLSPLSQSDSVALIDLLLTISELPAHLKQIIPQRAEGNPFYLEETIRMLIDRGIIRRSEDHWMMSPDADLSTLEVPRTLQGLILARVDHLNERPRYTIQCASIIGRDFSQKLLGNVVDSALNLDEDVHELEERELIHRLLELEMEYRFHHVLIQETVYNSILIRRRERLHHKIAEGIERIYKDRLEDHTEELAFHFSRSNDAERALPYLIRAGKRAADRFANASALDYYRQAAEYLPKTNALLNQRIEVYSGLGNVQAFVGNYDDAIKSYSVALELMRTSDSRAPRESADIIRRIGRVYERRGDYGEALHWLQNALTEIELDTDSAKVVERARIYNDIGWVHGRRGELEEAYQWRMRSLQIVEGSDHYNEMASAYNGLAVLSRDKGDWARALAYTEKALKLRENIGDSDGVSRSLTNLGAISSGQCNWNEALHYYEKSLEIKQKIGERAGISLLNNNLGVPYREKGNYPRAAEHFQKALDVAEGIKDGNAICLALNNLAHVRILQDQFDRAVSDLTRCMNIATEMGHKENLSEAQWLLAEARFGTGQLDESHNLANQAVMVASSIGKRLIEGTALRTLGKIARSRKSFVEARDYLQRSLAIFTELKNPFELAKTQFQFALLQRDQGQLVQARATLETAYATFARLGAERERERTRVELDRIATSTGKFSEN